MGTGLAEQGDPEDRRCSGSPACEDEQQHGSTAAAGLTAVAGHHRRDNTRVWYQPTYARRDQMECYAAEGYQGCIGRTLDRISIFPDGRCYVCSYLFDTKLNFAQMVDGQVELNHGTNEFDLFTSSLAESSCGGCKSSACMGGCPAEELVMGSASCAAYDDIVPVCRLWKSSAKPESEPA
ncbi:hypothetical protein [Nocardia amamiensis]|uniref:hypothetical protein n=1 Tax=Nocardia TaxID=1817 RepID=UPI0033C3A5C1